MDFWLEVNKYKQITDPTILKQKADNIYNTFLKHGSKREVNIRFVFFQEFF